MSLFGGKYCDAARQIVSDQIMTYVHKACPYPGDANQREWNEAIGSTLKNMSLSDLKDNLTEWQEDAGSTPL
jgi:predicted nucleotide-binding protein (sugar kinase/HSP70/actin superfamily)